MDSAEPRTLVAGRYRLGEILGRGGMGAVWQARDELLNRDVAVKEVIWPPHFTEAERQTACRRATREAQMAARLNHRNVIRIFDIVEEDGHPWIVMELLSYPSLRDLVLEDGPLTPVQAAKVGLGILAALRAAHALGILHRDVKPANILVGPDDRVVLTDFGIARGADTPTLTTTGVVIGSPSYIAPERARSGQSDPSGDLWGLGASLYAAVEGRPPFDRDSALANLTAVVTDEPEPAPHAGPLWPVISGLLRKDPAERLDAEQAERMLRDIEQASAEVAAERPATSQQGAPGAPRAPRSRRALAALAGLATLALIAAVAVTAALAMSGAPRQQTAARPPSSPPSTHAATHPGTRPGTAASPQPSARTSPTVTSRPASPSISASPSATSANPGYGALPAGYYLFTNPTGFSIGVPSGWQISHVGHYVYIRDPANGGIFLLIDQSDQPKPNALADWRQQEAARRSSYPDYHLIRLLSVHYPQAEEAADWEFTYDRNGVIVQVLNRNILANAHHAYALYWSVPESEWNAYYHYFQAFAATFRPAAP